MKVAAEPPGDDRPRGPFLAIVEGSAAMRTYDEQKARFDAIKRSLGRLTSCTAVLHVGDASSLVWFRNGREVPHP